MSEPGQFEAQIATVLTKLQLPSRGELAPYLAKTIAHPGSCIVLVIEAPLAHDGPRVGRCWLSSAEREKVRKALSAINGRRMKKGERTTDQSPD